MKFLGFIEENHICFRLCSYFMVSVLSATSYYRGGFSLCLDDRAMRVMVPGGSTFHLESVTIHPCWNLMVPDVLDDCWKSYKLHSFRFLVEEGVMFSAVIPPV